MNPTVHQYMSFMDTEKSWVRLLQPRPKADPGRPIMAVSAAIGRLAAKRGS